MVRPAAGDGSVRMSATMPADACGDTEKGEHDMRFGYVIRIGGDPEISAALLEGMEKGSPSGPAGHLPAHGGEALGQRAAGSEAVRRLAMMRHTPEEWRQMTEEARVIYGGRHYRPRWAERLLVGWAMICYGISRAYRAQARVLESKVASSGDSGYLCRPHPSPATPAPPSPKGKAFGRWPA